MMKSTGADENAKLEWIKHEDDTGTPFYENKESGRTTWTHRGSSGEAVDAYVANPMKTKESDEHK